MMNLILASGSPRRKLLLETVGIPIFSIQPANIREQRSPSESPLEYCVRLAKEKAYTVAQPGCWTLAADTIVCQNNSVFEKPLNKADAFRMLKHLSNGWHSVISAWHLVGYKNSNSTTEKNGYTVSQVRFRSLSDVEITNYINTNEHKIT